MTELCPDCERQFHGGILNRNEAVLQKHRTHLSAKALAEGGYVEAVFGSYGCESGCEYTTYEVYDAKDVRIASHGSFGEPDEETLREWAAYYGVRVFGA